VCGHPPRRFCHGDWLVPEAKRSSDQRQPGPNQSRVAMFSSHGQFAAAVWARGAAGTEVDRRTSEEATRAGVQERVQQELGKMMRKTRQEELTAEELAVPTEGRRKRRSAGVSGRQRINCLLPQRSEQEWRD
jgi:hypothetical protein